MNRTVTFNAALLLGASACVVADPVEAELLVPEDIALHWDRSFNGVDDDRVAVVPVDVMVYESESGEPLEGVALEVDPGSEVIDLLPFDAVFPLDADDCDGRPCLWDARRDRYLDLGAGMTALDMPVHTDMDGLARFYVLVDGFPSNGGEFEPVSVVVSTANQQAAFQLVPQ